MLKGACYCLSVNYEVADEFGYAMNCHCQGCRRTTGAAFKPFAGIARNKLSVTSGQQYLLINGDTDNNNTHCGKCGSLLFSVVRDGEYVHVALGTLTDSPSIRPGAHIFVGSKAPWFEITDELPQFDGFPE
ncbi:MAG: GFA family protein [Pseudomonadales bacterium]|nr:GFA family protein [Pseudomonadales bacterium]